MMKKIATIIAAVALGTTALSGFASPDGYDPSSDRLEMRMKRMTNNLNLDEDQQQQIKVMLEKQMQERQARRKRMHDEIKSVLNEEQQTRFTMMKEKHKHRRAARMARHQGKNCDQPGRHERHKRYDD